MKRHQGILSCELTIHIRSILYLVLDAGLMSNSDYEVILKFICIEMSIKPYIRYFECRIGIVIQFEDYVICHHIEQTFLGRAVNGVII